MIQRITRGGAGTGSQDRRWSTAGVKFAECCIIRAGKISVLKDSQIARVWEDMLAAETRSLYFGDLASRYAGRKQWITGLSFFFSSSAAATAVGKSPQLVPVILAIAVAVMNAYAMAVNLDGQIATMVKLHGLWNQIGLDYDRLWNHAYDDDAEERLEKIANNEKEASEIATTNAPNDERLFSKWQDRVFALYHLKGQHG
jgi:hypothetical protein